MPQKISPYQWYASILRDDAPLFSDLDSSVSEEELWQAGLENGVLVLANQKLSNSTTLASLSKTFTEKLHKDALNAAATEMGQKHELTKILSMFSAQQIRYLLIKGTPLAYSHYPEPYLRSRCDTDILFATKEDAEKAWLILKELGYERPNAVSGEYVSHEFSCYRKEKIGISHAMDIHWKISNSQVYARAFAFEELYSQSRTVDELDEDAHALSDTYALLLACLHRIAHKPEGMHNRLIWLYDIHLLATGFTPEQWEELYTLTSQKGFCGICLDGLKTTMATLGTDINDDLIKQFEESAKNEKYDSGINDSRIGSTITNLQALPDWKSKLILVKELFFPDPNYMMVKFDTRNKALLPYLYLKRAVGGLFKVFR
jgi:hypothetical protein